MSPIPKPPRVPRVNDLVTEIMRCTSGLLHEYFSVGGDEQLFDSWVNSLYMATRRYLVAKREMRRKA